jgi:hypothetical protein
MRCMTRYVDEDLRGAEFRECDLTGVRLVGVVHHVRPAHPGVVTPVNADDPLWAQWE